MSDPKIQDLVYWINERIAVQKRREAGLPPPWSADPIFQRVRFCNVRREDDRVTRWFRKNWNKPDDPAWKFVLGRMINLTESLAEMLPAGDHLGDMKRVLEVRRAGGHKIFTSVYTISTCGRKMDKMDYVFDVVVQAVAEAGEPEYHSLAAAHENLTCIDGLGDFLSGQVLADMKNTGGHPLAKAPDWWDWYAPGPGSIKGLEAFWGHRVTKTNFRTEFDKCRALVSSQIPKISAQDFQNCLCEFSKYMRVRDENGHVRNVFVPSKEPL